MKQNCDHLFRGRRQTFITLPSTSSETNLQVSVQVSVLILIVGLLCNNFSSVVAIKANVDSLLSGSIGQKA